MERIVRDFLSGFGTVCPPVLVDQSERRAIVRMTDALALLSDGTFVTSPYHSILQKLPGQFRRPPAVRAARALRIRRAQTPCIPSSTHPAAPLRSEPLLGRIKKVSCYCIPTLYPSRPDGILTAASFSLGGSTLRPPPHPAGLHMLDMTLHEAPKTFLAAHLNAFAQPDSTPAHDHASWFAGVAETRLPVSLPPPAPARSCQKRHARRPRSRPLRRAGRAGVGAVAGPRRHPDGGRRRPRGGPRDLNFPAGKRRRGAPQLARLAFAVPVAALGSRVPAAKVRRRPAVRRPPPLPY